MVLAGPGSGKTSVIVERTAYMINEGGISPSNILVVTFSRAAAKEMKERVSALTGEKGEEVWVSTFHSMCARFLRMDADKIGYTRDFTIYDRDAANTLMKKVLATAMLAAVNCRNK
mgnify:CR=1 FL=1